MSELPGLRPVWGEVDLGAIRANVEILLDAVAPAQLLAVVKADGYGHGSIPVAAPRWPREPSGLALPSLKKE